MNHIENLHQTVLKKVKDADVRLSIPNKPTNWWMLDVIYPDYHLCVEWKADMGFGLTSNETHGYGEGCHETYKTLAEVLPRVLELVQGKLATIPPAGISV